MKRGVLVAAAFATDLLFGDPHGLPHPVRAIGAFASRGERFARRYTHGDVRRETIAGAMLTATLVTASWGAATVTVSAARRAGLRAADACEIALAWTTIAVRDLLLEADAVIEALSAGDESLARARLARIVGRDTALLDRSEIVRATIETLAESACDGIVAPLCALALAGVPAAFAFKAASTLDSMLGHIEAPYTSFGRAAARLDDALCWLPARIAAAAIALLAPVVGGSSRAAFATWRTDGGRHRSPNAGHPEAAMAGALGVRLGGRNTYDGVVHDAPLLGAQFATATVSDARRARDLVLAAAVGCAAVATLLGSRAGR